MVKEYVGTIVLTINGVDVECKSFSGDRDPKRKAVASMNRTGKPQGTTRGIMEYSLSVTAPVQPSGYEPDWDNVEDAVLSVNDRKGKLLEQYAGVFTKKVGTKYEMEGESVHDVEMGALDYVNVKALIRL